MIKWLFRIFALLLLVILVAYLIPVKQHRFEDLYNDKEEIKNSLGSFRNYPLDNLKNNETTWQYLSIGQGKKHLLFLHGMGGAYDIWWQQIAHLKKDHHIISITLPEVHSLDEAVEGLKAILDKEEVNKVSIIGSSMGGYIAQYFLNKYPERLDHLVLGNTFPPNDIFIKENGGIRKVVPFLPEWLIMRTFKTNVSETVVPTSENSALVEAYLHEQYSGYMSKQQFIGRLDVVLDYFEPELGPQHKAIPKLIIESDNDPLIKPVLQKQLKELYVEAGVYTFKNKGHFPYLNAADEYSAVLRGFLLNTDNTD